MSEDMLGCQGSWAWCSSAHAELEIGCGKHCWEWCVCSGGQAYAAQGCLWKAHLMRCRPMGHLSSLSYDFRIQCFPNKLYSCDQTEVIVETNYCPLLERVKRTMTSSWRDSSWSIISSLTASDCLFMSSPGLKGRSRQLKPIHSFSIDSTSHAEAIASSLV